MKKELKVIFLDVDGCLNSEEYLRRGCQDGERFHEIDESKVSLLKEIVDNTGAELVLSSTWRGLKSVCSQNEAAHELYMYLEEQLSKFGLCIQFSTPIINENRPLEIKEWLGVNEVESFVILDDDFDYAQYAAYHLEDNLVKTTFYGSNGGLQEDHVKKAITVLNREKRG